MESFDKSISNINNDSYKGIWKHHYENITTSNIEHILGQKDSCFLKCDIDGGEYEILDYLINNSYRFTGVVIEFHDINIQNNFNDLTNFISKFGLRLIHTHVNNYSYIIDEYKNYYITVIELSFSNFKINTRLSNNTIMPNKLDMPNNPNDDEFKLNF